MDAKRGGGGGVKKNRNTVQNPNPTALVSLVFYQMPALVPVCNQPLVKVTLVKLGASTAVPPLSQASLQPLCDRPRYKTALPSTRRLAGLWAAHPSRHFGRHPGTGRDGNGFATPEKHPR